MTPLIVMAPPAKHLCFSLRHCEFAKQTWQSTLLLFFCTTNALCVIVSRRRNNLSYYPIPSLRACDCGRGNPSFLGFFLFWFTPLSWCHFLFRKKVAKETHPKCNCPSDTLRIFVLIGSSQTHSVVQTVLALIPINTSNTWQLQRG
jgi:hypothetical protein